MVNEEEFQIGDRVKYNDTVVNGVGIIISKPLEDYSNDYKFFDWVIEPEEGYSKSYFFDYPGYHENKKVRFFRSKDLNLISRKETVESEMVDRNSPVHCQLTTVRTIKPGKYGRLNVGKNNNLVAFNSGGEKYDEQDYVELGFYGLYNNALPATLFNASEIRELISNLSDIADAMESGELIRNSIA